MASIYRRKRTKTIPKGSQVVTRQDKHLAEWIDGKTKRKRRAPLTADGDKIVVTDEHYTIEYTDENGKRCRVSAGTPDKDAAKQLANKLQTEARLRQRGLLDTKAESISTQSRRPIEQHVAQYETKLRSAGRDKKYIANTLSYIRAIITFCDFKTANGINADELCRFAVNLRETERRSARTVQAYLKAITSFTKWLAANHKLTSDPLAHVQKPDPKSDRRRQRRMLLPQEWTWLRLSTHNCPERFGMTGSERVLLYAVAIQTGLRAGELRSLTQGRLFLTAELPFITCKAGSTKNKKEARQYIQPDLANQLQQHVSNRRSQSKVFGLPSKFEMVDMLRADVAQARTAWIETAGDDRKECERRQQSDFLCEVNHDGEVLDFHCLRHTCGGWAAMSGAHPKAIQALMRHSTITLTMDTYGHLLPGQEAETVARMPPMLSGPTSSDDDPDLGQYFGPYLDGQLWQDVVRAGEPDKVCNGDTAGQKVLPANTFDNCRPDVASAGESAPSRTRTLSLFVGESRESRNRRCEIRCSSKQLGHRVGSVA